MSTEKATVTSLVSYLIEGLQDDAGRVRVEELLSAAASVVGERCIEAAGEFDPRTHSFTPGERVFSETVNELLTGNVSSQIADVSPTSVFGIIRDTITTRGYHISEFPALEALFAGFSSRIGDPVDWGRVPLSVPDENKPYLLPLQVAYETRRGVDQLLSMSGSDAKAHLRLSALALGETLVTVAEAIDGR